MLEIPIQFFIYILYIAETDIVYKQTDSLRHHQNAGRQPMCIYAFKCLLHKKNILKKYKKNNKNKTWLWESKIPFLRMQNLTTALRQHFDSLSTMLECQFYNTTAKMFYFFTFTLEFNFPRF